MSKAPEEGKVWEWRAFGRVEGWVSERIRAFPVRMEMVDVYGEDIYFVAPCSDQNIKLRKSGEEWNLKFKLLLAKEDSIELYKETAEYVYRFPVGPDRLEETARLLNVKPPEETLRARAYNVAEFVALMEGADPPVHLTPTKKVRSQYQFEGGWFELADVSFPQHRLQSVSVQSPELEIVKRTLEQTNLTSELEPMNYVEACRRWGAAQ